MRSHPSWGVFVPLVLLSFASLVSCLRSADLRRGQKPLQEEKQDLFEDVDPRTLAAVLLEALNHSYGEQERNYRGMKDEGTEGSDRQRDGRQELEMLIASHGEEEQEEKRRKAEEEKMTEKVRSRTTSQSVPLRLSSTETPPAAAEEEEQLSPEELRSLETVMKEFPRLEEKPEEVQRENRAFTSFNEVLPPGKDLAMTKKKLKWQEETQKGLLFPSFMESNSVDEGVDEEVLSPEEEEAQAKEEQEELLRQAAEAQKAKQQEEKLADVASDMLLRYMGNSRKAAPPSDAAEDKRSEEEPEEDIDPQTIDKLIEISSKLHLPADDVVDIIADVEKKKKKDIPPEVSLPWQRPPPPPAPPKWSQKEASPAVNLLKSWFQKKKVQKSDDSQRLLSKFWSRPEKTRLQTFPYMHPPQRVYPDYRPVPRPVSYYYPPKPLAYLSNSADYALQPRRYYPGWIHRPVSYYPPIAYPRPILRAPPPPRVPQKQFYSPVVGLRNQDVYEARKPSDSNLGDVERYIQQILKKMN